ncbi:MAG: hypothetical protein J6Y91_00270 [Alphaproteobacteria bacterium]|nr:hypothetical protein [Alphaproteobacteria bacterium]
MEKPEQPLKTFSPLSLMEYIRLMTAAVLLKQENAAGSVNFRISAADYDNMMAEKLHTPLLSLTLEYDSVNSVLKVTPDSDFMPQYDNKIMKEVVLTFYDNYKNRYAQWLMVED